MTEDLIICLVGQYRIKKIFAGDAKRYVVSVPIAGEIESFDHLGPAIEFCKRNRNKYTVQVEWEG